MGDFSCPDDPSQMNRKARQNPRPLIVTFDTPVIAKGLHNYGRGRKFIDPDTKKDIWINPDLIQTDIEANYQARKAKRDKMQSENPREKNRNKRL